MAFTSRSSFATNREGMTENRGPHTLLGPGPPKTNLGPGPKNHERRERSADHLRADRESAPVLAMKASGARALGPVRARATGHVPRATGS
jgi:hypothetical protein